MNVVKKLLIAHGDQKIRRRLVLFLADAGYDLRAFGSVEAATESARNEWFDLALIDYELSGTRDFSFVEMLKKIQPTVPIILFVQQFELSIIVKGIRVGVTDVMSHGDLTKVGRRVAAIFNPDAPVLADGEGVTPAELAEVEVALDRMTGRDASDGPDSLDHSVGDLPAELLRGAKERAMLEAKNARIEVEKSAIEAELKTLLSQLADASRLEVESAELHSQLEIAAAAQAAIDAKARQLAETRAEIARERTALEEERRRVAGKSDDEQVKERADRETWSAQLHQEDDRLREEAARLQHETVRLARERRRWHDDLDLLREQEKNLRDYEVRLRQVQAQLEADRVLWFSARNPAAPSPFADDPALKDAWQKLQRATELLEAERANFRDEKLLFAEHQTELKRREEKARDLMAKIEERNALPPPPPSQASPNALGVAASAVKSFSRAPFEAAKAVFSGKKDE